MTQDTPIDAELHKWWVEDIPGEGVVFHGRIHGDRKQRFADGTPIRTSLVMSREDDIIQTLNTTYKIVGQEDKGQ